MDERSYGLLNLFSQAAQKYSIPQIMKMKYNVKDRGSQPDEYNMCYKKTMTHLASTVGPDWVCFWWKSANIDNYESCVQRISALGQQKPTSDQVAWFGNLNSPLNDVPEYYTRPRLQEIALANPTLLHVQHVPPHNDKIDERVPNYMTLHDMVQKYKYLLDIGGNGYSGRLKFLLFSHRPVFVVDREYIEYFHNLLVPFIHYIPVREDLSDLVDKIRWANANQQKCQEIAEAAYTFATTHLVKDKFLERIRDVYNNLATKGTF